MLEIEEGLTIPHQLKIQFTTFGETVFEQEVEVEKKAISGTAIDLDTENNLIDLYMVIVPVSEELEEYYTGESNSPTGAAVANPIQEEAEEYFLEFNINKKSSSFSDLYGPYQIEKEQSLVFAQQLKYDAEMYFGPHTITTKIYRGGEVIIEDEFEVDFGGEAVSEPNFNWLWLSIFVIIFLFMGISTYFGIIKGRRLEQDDKESVVKAVKIPLKKEKKSTSSLEVKNKKKQLQALIKKRLVEIRVMKKKKE